MRIFCVSRHFRVRRGAVESPPANSFVLGAEQAIEQRSPAFGELHGRGQRPDDLHLGLTLCWRPRGPHLASRGTGKTPSDEREMNT